MAVQILLHPVQPVPRVVAVRVQIPARVVQGVRVRVRLVHPLATQYPAVRVARVARVPRQEAEPPVSPVEKAVILITEMQALQGVLGWLILLGMVEVMVLLAQMAAMGQSVEQEHLHSAFLVRVHKV